MRGFNYQFRAFKCPIHANALPRLILLASLALKTVISPSVQAGWSGMTMSKSVRLAAHKRLERRSDWACEIAIIVPKPRVALAGVMICDECERFGGSGICEIMMRKRSRRLRATRERWSLRSIVKMR
jgi:hypothetical protein